MPPPSSSSRAPAPSGGGGDLFGAVLASVSRSFYLTIRVLPAPVRRPVALAYLLARTSDTVADSAGIPAAERLGVLREFGRAIAAAAAARSAEGRVAERIGALAGPGGGVDDPAERTLLGHAGALLALTRQLEPGDRAEVARVLGVIVPGQELDLERFSEGSARHPAALASAAELDDYTYRVAGCVGEFWTRLCFRHLPRYAAGGRSEEEMVALAIAYGKGLQLVNILRDLPADLAAGRCYLPAEELAREGIAPGELLASPRRARPVVERWLLRARGHLADGRRYLEAVRPWRLRFACFLPWAIGVRTIALLEAHPPLETAGRLKVPRREIRRLLAWGIVAASGNGFLARFAPPGPEKRGCKDGPPGV